MSNVGEKVRPTFKEVTSQEPHCNLCGERIDWALAENDGFYCDCGEWWISPTDSWMFRSNDITTSAGSGEPQ